MSAIQVERLVKGYNDVRGNTHDTKKSYYDPRTRDPKGWGYWVDRMNKEHPPSIVDIALSMLAKEAGL